MELLHKNYEKMKNAKKEEKKGRENPFTRKRTTMIPKKGQVNSSSDSDSHSSFD
jgi:hypothetical protein